MKHISGMARFAFSVCAIVAVLGGCGGSRQAFSPPSGTTPNLKTSSGNALPAVDRGHERSWMAPAAAHQPTLLYVSNTQIGDVTVYTYLTGGLRLVGTLTGFSMPTGMCTDNAGNVWIPDYTGMTIFEYAHGGTKRIASIKQIGQPYDCSVDRNSGNLAVANRLPNGKYQHGDVTVYIGAKPSNFHRYGPPQGFAEVDFLAYDNRGNLFVDGAQLHHGPRLFELPDGQIGGSLTVLKFSGATLHKPGAIDPAHPVLLIGDRNYQNQGVPAAYKVFVSGSVATVVGVLPFAGTQDTYGFWRRAEKVIVPDFRQSVVRIYSLPGGSLFSTFSKGIAQPFGAIVSHST
jgi:hypothetical protein